MIKCLQGSRFKIKDMESDDNVDLKVGGEDRDEDGGEALKVLKRVGTRIGLKMMIKIKGGEDDDEDEGQNQGRSCEVDRRW